MYEIKKDGKWNLIKTENKLYFFVNNIIEKIGEEAFLSIKERLLEIDQLDLKNFEGTEYVSDEDTIIIFTQPEVGPDIQKDALNVVRKLIQKYKYQITNEQDPLDRMIYEIEQYHKITKTMIPRLQSIEDTQNNTILPKLENIEKDQKDILNFVFKKMDEGFEEIKNEREKRDSAFKRIWDFRAWICKKEIDNWEKFDMKVKNKAKISSWKNASLKQCIEAYEIALEIYKKYNYKEGNYQRDFVND